MKKALASIVAILAISSTAFAGGNMKLDIKAPATVKKGEAATATVAFKGDGKDAKGDEFHVNPDYAHKLILTAPAGVKLEKDTIAKGDAGVKVAQEGAEFTIKFTASDVGKKEITGKLKYATCTKNECKPAEEAISIKFESK